MPKNTIKSVPKPREVKKHTKTLPEGKKATKASLKKEKAKLEADCDKLWSLCVRERDKICRYCGSDYKLSAHHIRGRAAHSTGFLIRNGITLCWENCHCLQKFNPEKFQDRVIEVIGDEEYQALKRMSLVVVKHDNEDLRIIKEHLEKELRRLKSE